ncbi:MAG: MFS transporter [Mycobacteriaceae bacterium]
MQPDLKTGASRFLVNRDFARLWYGQAISTVGDFVFDTTLTIWVATSLSARSHWAPAAVSGLMLCALAAIILVGPVAGVFVDRWSRRRTMLASEVIRGLLVGLLTLVTLLPRDALPAGLWLAILYAVVFVVNAAGQFFNPARFATIGEIVPDEADRTKAVGLGQATAATAAIIGPPLAAPLLFTLGIQGALLINALSYAVSFFAVRSVHFPNAEAAAPTTGETARKPAWRVEFAAGVKMFAANRFLVALLTVAVISSLGVGALTPLLVFFMSDNLHTATRLLDFMTMAYGLGSVVGSLVAGRAARLVGARNLTWSGLLATGCLLALYARQTDFSAAMALMFLMAIPVAALNAGLSPLLMAATQKEFMGRMIAVFTPVNMAASVGSVVIAGWLASTVLADFHATVAGLHVGRIDTIYTASACLIIAAGVYGCFALPRPNSKPTTWPAMSPSQR